MLRQAAGGKAALPAAARLAPLAEHGAGARGLADRPLAKLRAVAATVAGAAPSCGRAAAAGLCSTAGPRSLSDCAPSRSAGAPAWTNWPAPRRR